MHFELLFESIYFVQKSEQNKERKNMKRKEKKVIK